MMLTAMTIDKADPPFGESFKGVELPGIDDVVDDAGNHLTVSIGHLESALRRHVRTCHPTRRQKMKRVLLVGLDPENCFISPDETAVPTVEHRLASEHYDCMVVGAGVRG